MFRKILLTMCVPLALASCNDAETAQMTRGGNEIGPATTKAANDNAVPIPAVRNVMETESRPIAPAEAEQVPAR